MAPNWESEALLLWVWGCTVQKWGHMVRTSVELMDPSLCIFFAPASAQSLAVVISILIEMLERIISVHAARKRECAVCVCILALSEEPY